MTTSTTETAAGDDVPVRPLGPATVALRWLVVVTLVALLAQFAFAGYGAFTTLRPNHPHGSYRAHEMLGQAIGGLEFLIALLALLARRRRDAVVALVACLLVTPCQQMLADAGRTTAAIGALHGLVGVVVLVLTGWIFVRLGWRGTPR